MEKTLKKSDVLLRASPALAGTAIFSRGSRATGVWNSKPAKPGFEGLSKAFLHRFFVFVRFSHKFFCQDWLGTNRRKLTKNTDQKMRVPS